MRSIPQVRNLNSLRVKDAKTAEMFDDLLAVHSNVAIQLASDPNGHDTIPPSVASLQIQVSPSGGLVDVTITDPGKIQRAIGYHLEYDTDPNFSNPRGVDLGSWRNHTLVLPNGKYYFRAYSQYKHGGPPSPPIRFQAPVTVLNSASLSLLPSQGSGTGKPNTGGAAGAGKQVSR